MIMYRRANHYIQALLYNYRCVVPRQYIVVARQYIDVARQYIIMTRFGYQDVLALVPAISTTRGARRAVLHRD